MHSLRSWLRRLRCPLALSQLPLQCPRLEESHRIRGKGRAHFARFHSMSSARSSCRLFADPGETHGERTVKHTLPPRPDLDQLRRQAKSLLAALAQGNAEAAATMISHLPAAKGMNPERARSAGFR